MKQINILLVLLILLSGNTYCQSVSASSYTSLTEPKQAVVKEKIFVHTDKTFYIAGEIIWFKIYCVDASSHQPCSLSKVAYIELTDTLNKPVAQAKIELHNGTGSGSFSLSPTVSSGNYTVRSYTNWMKNEGADYFFQKNITVINVQKLTVNKVETEAEKDTVRFFPEGGNLVYNLNNHVAFQGNDQYGKGVALAGWLMEDKDTLLTFKSDLYGIGSFDFIPQKTHTYKAVIRSQKGIVFTQNLPLAYANGYIMNVMKMADSSLQTTITSANISDEKIYLLIHRNGRTLVAKENELQDGKAVFTIKEAALPEGTSYITIFNSQKQPICERLYFKKGFEKLRLTASDNHSSYGIRKKVSISVGAENLDSNTDSAYLSMSVYWLDSLQSLDDNKIENYLFFTSEIKGSAGHADYYLTNDTALQNLMLVNSRSHFITDVANNNATPLFAFAPEYDGHIITGQITDIQTGLPKKNTTAYLSVPGKGTQFYPGFSDSIGNIRWETKDFYGASKVIAQTYEEQDSHDTIRIDDPFSHQYATAFSPVFTLPRNCPNTLSEHSISMQVQHIYSDKETEQFNIPLYDTVPFYSKADKTYRLDDYTRFTTLEEVLREYIMLVNVTKRKGDYHFPVYDYGSQKMFNSDPLVLLDGVPFFNLTHFVSFDPLKIQTLDVVNRRFLYGNAVFDGILNWKSYNGDLAETDLDPGALIVDYDGLALQRKFYSPSYETAEQQDSHVPDFRNLLYWNPDIIIKGTQQQVSFYTSDLPGNYAVVIQGISTSGLAGSQTFIFDVRKE